MYRYLRMELLKMGKVNGVTLMVTLISDFHAEATKGLFPKGRLFPMVSELRYSICGWKWLILEQLMCKGPGPWKIRLWTWFFFCNSVRYKGAYDKHQPGTSSLPHPFFSVRQVNQGLLPDTHRKRDIQIYLDKQGGSDKPLWVIHLNNYLDE